MGATEIMSRIQLKVIYALIMKALKDVRQVKNIPKEIKVQIISERSTLEHTPHLESVLIVVRSDLLVI